MNDLNRRHFLNNATALAGLPMLYASPAMAEALKITMGIGLTTEAGAITKKMQQDKLLEQACKELGLGSVEADYLSFPVLLRMLQGIAAGQLQFGTLGGSPTVRSLSSQDPVVPIAIVGGGNLFPLQVPKNSPIKNLNDLKGKTVLTIVGSDLHQVLVRMVKANFSVEDPKQVGITVRNINAITELSRPQPGIDAVVGVDPTSSAAEREGAMVTIVYNNGFSGAGYDGPEGRGAGHKLACFAKSPFTPEAFLPHRIYLVARRDFLASNPKAVTALLVANQRATALLAKGDNKQIIQYGGDSWAGTPETQASWLDTVLWRRRGWAWLTEGDMRILVGMSLCKPIFPTALDPDAVKKICMLGADVARAAYENVGRFPARADFDDQRAELRGKPSWEAAAWNLNF